jgi:hypothetical protein
LVLFFKKELLSFLKPITLKPLALHLPRTADGFCGFAGATLGGLLVMPTELHFAKNPFALHLLLERLERLIDIVVTDENLHLAACSLSGGTPDHPKCAHG